MEQNEEKVFGVLSPLSTFFGNTLAGGFVAGNKIAVWPHMPILSSTLDRPTPYAGKEEIQIQLLQSEFVFDDPILRSLVAEATSTFVTVQGFKHKKDKANFLKCSRAYRSVIRACLEKLQDALSVAEQENDKQGQTAYFNFITTFYSIECIWHLCEMLFLDTVTSHLAMSHLLRWIRFHFPNAERSATDLLLLGREANESDNFWLVLKGLIMQGQVELVRTLLKMHPSAESGTFNQVEQILSAMPNYTVFGGYSAEKFRSKWEYWLYDAQSKLRAGLFNSEPDLEELLLLITSDPETWDKYIKDSKDWYELLPGYLSFHNPTCKVYELSNISREWYNRWLRLRTANNASTKVTQLDRLVLSVMQIHLHEVITSVQQMGDSQWFATHLTDLLYNSGTLDMVRDDNVTDYKNLRDTLVYDFGSCLMTRNCLWQSGMDYLEHCGGEGKAALELLLAKVPTTTDKQRFKLLSVAQTKGLPNVGLEICKVQARNALTAQRYSTALEWALRCKDILLVSSIADFVLRHYADTGIMECQDILSNLGEKMFISPRLVFLVKYNDFYRMYRKRDFGPAAELLINLLDSKLTPRFFWPSLLLDCIPLLECKEPKIMADETLIIMNYMQRELIPYVAEQKKSLSRKDIQTLGITKKYRIDNLEEAITLLSLACARNLARAELIEGNNAARS